MKKLFAKKIVYFKRSFFLVTFCTLASLRTTGQNLNISGTLLDSNNDPIVGATVQVKGTANGVTTGINGDYNIAASPDATLTFSFLGMGTHEEAVAGRGRIDVVMAEGSHDIDEVVVTAYGMQKKSSVTGSIAVIKDTELKTVTSSNVNAMLQGKVAGVQVLGTSGKPNEAAQIRIRGKASFGSTNDPLWVIDGVVSSVGAPLNPNEIATLTVLKDAAATALYGSRATNGVILVTTKGGKQGEQSINVSAKVGAASVYLGKFKLMNSQELYDYTASMAGDKPSWFTPSLKDNNTDWLDVSTQTALTHNYTLSYTNGTEKVRTYLMADYYNEEGTVKGFQYTRYSLRANNDYIANKRLTVKTKFSGSYYHNFSQAYSMGGAMLYLPWDNPYDVDGIPRRITNPTADWYSRYQSNPVYDLPFSWERGKALGVSGNVGFDFKITDWLIFESTNNISYRYTLDETYTDPKAIGAEEYNGALTSDNNFYTTLFTTQLLRFIKTFEEKHDVTAFLGYEYSDYNAHTNSAEKRGIPQNSEVFNTAATPYAIDGNVNEWALQSVFFNANYTYDERYMAQFSLRTDGSSRFGSDNRYGTFYTVGAGWAIHKESFFKNLARLSDYVNEFKLRASYGSIGNLPSATYGYLTTYSLNRSYNGVPAATPNRLGNTALSWEKCYETNIAIDMRLLDRFGLSVEYYNKNTSDLLYDVPQSSVSGYSSQWQNVGAIRNQGVEIVFSPDIIRTPDILWTADFNIGINRGTAVKLIEVAAEGNRQIIGGDMSAQTVRKEGTPLDTWYVREWAGVDIYSGEPMWYKYNDDGSRELTNNWNDATRVEAGTQNPKFSGGLATSVTWKGITLAASMNFVYGNKVFNGARQFYDNDGAYPTFNSMKLKDGWVRWTQPGDIATHPKPVYGGNASSQNPSTRYLEDGSFFKLGSLSLSYALPQKWLQKVNVKGLDITLSGEKLFTLTNYSGFDPEVAGSTGTLGEGMQYPAPRRFSVGLNLTF